MKLVATILAVSFSLMFGTAQLTILVDEIPSYTPPEDPIHIAGDFQGWDPGSPAHQLTKDSMTNNYIITLQVGIGAIEFKFTRGNWAKVEADEFGGFIPNRTYSGSDGDTVRLQILGWEDIGALCEPPDPPGSGSTAAENVHIMNDTFYMPQFDRCRRIWVYLPPDYEESDRSYPVMYMHDGQNVFDATTSFISEWEVDETLNRLHVEGDSGVIVVGIDNGGAFRTEEYIPWDNPQIGDTRGELYADFIVNTLKPVVDATYRTLSDRNNTAVMGSSFGGVISSYCGLEYQEVFSKVGAFSQSYWVSEDAFVHADTTGRQHPMRIYQLMGALEGSNAVQDMYRMESTLHDAGFAEDEVISIEKPDGEHSEWFWAREFEAAYLWLFHDQTVSTPTGPNPSGAVKLFPNPATDHITIELELFKTSDVNVELYDPVGRLIQSSQADTLQTGPHQMLIQLLEIQYMSGVYICKVIVADEFYVKTFTVTD